MAEESVHGRRKARGEIRKGRGWQPLPAQWILQCDIKPERRQAAKRINASWKYSCCLGLNPAGDMNSLTSISASDLIWQMDTYYTISEWWAR